MFDHKQLTVVIMGTSSWQVLPDTVSTIMDLGEAMHMLFLFGSILQSVRGTGVGSSRL